VAVDLSRFEAGSEVYVAALYPGSNGLELTEPSARLLSVGDECETLDFELAPGEIEPAPGQPIDNEWAVVGIGVSAANKRRGHPDLAIIFDGANPSGDDTDQFVPELGQLLIIAENHFDGDGDGFIDDQDDEEGRGRLSFEFETDVTLFGATVLEVDGGEFDFFEAFDGFGNSFGMLEIPTRGDNSVQMFQVEPPLAGVRKLGLILDGSCAVSRLRFCPDPPDDLQ